MSSTAGEPRTASKPMGWTRNTVPKPKATFVAECIAELNRYYSVAASTVKGDNLWMIVEKVQEDPIILLYLIDKYEGCWGYKSIAEVEHPFYFSCPLKFLEKAPVKNQAWRDGVREFHNEKNEKNAGRNKKRFAIGDKVQIPGIDGIYEITEVLGRKGYGIRKGNLNYRMTCRMASTAQIVS
jgi:hypothetical protein